jgi:hypothetical protein
MASTSVQTTYSIVVYIKETPVDRVEVGSPVIMARAIGYQANHLLCPGRLNLPGVKNLFRKCTERPYAPVSLFFARVAGRGEKVWGSGTYNI